MSQTTGDNEGRFFAWVFGLMVVCGLAAAFVLLQSQDSDSKIKPTAQGTPTDASSQLPATVVPNPLPDDGGGSAERAVQPTVTTVVAVSGAKAGERREADFGGGVKLELCGIPAGTFIMGGTGSDETPHQVTLTKPFWLGRTEVTQAQWEAVMGRNPSHFKGMELPVETVSWYDASDFCKKLNAKGLLPEGWCWTLPTEAQWEYACRAGTTGAYAGDLDAMAWYSSNSGEKTHPVGIKKPNAYGLSDMHGNVWEWCADWYGPYSNSVSTNPIGPNTGSFRVRRGGSWFHDGTDCRSARRNWYSPGPGDNSIGFRVSVRERG